MNVKKWIIAAVACSASALDAYDEQNESSSVTDSYKVCHVSMNAGFAPFRSQTSEGNVKGFDVDLMNAVAKADDFKVEFKRRPWGSLFPPFGNGDIDIVIFGIAITDERKQSMDFGDPYFEITQAVLVPKGKRVASSDNLKNIAKVGIVTGQTGDFPVSKLLGDDNPKVSRFEAVSLIVKELKNKGLDSVISDSAVIANYMKNNPAKGLDFVTLPGLSVENYGIVVRRGDEATAKMLSDALKKVRESDEYDKTYAEYFAKEGAKTGKAEKTK